MTDNSQVIPSVSKDCRLYMALCLVALYPSFVNSISEVAHNAYLVAQWLECHTALCSSLLAQLAGPRSKLRHWQHCFGICSFHRRILVAAGHLASHLTVYHAAPLRSNLNPKAVFAQVQVQFALSPQRGSSAFTVHGNLFRLFSPEEWLVNG